MLTLYERNTGGRMKGMMIAVSGGILASGMGLGTLVLSIFGAVGHISSLVTGGTCFMAVGALTGVGLLAGGSKKLGKLERFQKYIDTLGNHTYCNFEQLSAAVNKPVKFVKKDIKKMIDDRWFRQGHIDAQETCLITSNETYQQYTQTQKALEQKQQEENAKEEKTTAETKAAVVAMTPMLKQFYELKGKHPDAVLLFRCGDFYETYSQDAEKASKILGITLTKSSHTKDAEGKPLAMAGFPYHALDTYLPKLIRAGERVAI